MERKDLQPLITKAITEALNAAEVPPDQDHIRRVVRVLLRQAARVAINHGCPINAFLGLAHDAFKTETGEKEYPTANVFPEVPKDEKEVN
jgi:hypothetical protein